MRRFGAALAAYAAMVGLYLALAGSLDAVELASAAASGVPAALLGERMAAVSHRRFPLALPAKALLRPLASLLPDAAATGRELLAVGVRGRARDGRPRGAFLRQPFLSGGDEAATRRAAVLIGLSLAPRSFVVRGEDADELLLHALPEKPASPDLDWPL